MKLKTYFFAFALIISIITAGCPKEDEDDNTNTNTNTGNTNTAQSNLTGTVSITGTPQTGKILTASTSNLGGSGTISYQWKRGDSSDVADTVISGAASATYTLTTDDEGKFIKVTVTRAGFLGNITSDAVGAVLPAQAPTPTVTSVTIDPETKSLLRGETQQFTATVTGTNDPAQSVTWSVEGGVTGTDITHDGILTVSAKEKAATLTVVAKSTFDKNKSGTATVTVLYPTVTSVSVSPSTISVNKGETWLFTATVNGANDPAQSVTWSVTGGISGTSINDNGLLTVAFGETAATLTVRATSTEDASKSGTATVTATTPPLTGSVSVSGTAQAGHTLTANTSNLVGSGNISYQWTSSDTSTGTFTNISGATSATYPVVPNDVGKHIKVTVTRAGYLGSVTSSNTVGPVIAAQAPTPTVTGVTVSPTTATLLKGATQQFTATVTGTNDPAQTVSWTVTGGGTGTGIDANGLLTVSTSQAAATLTVRATSTVDTSKSATATVTVPVPTVTSVTVTPSTATVNKTKTQQFTATVNGTNSPAQTVTWTVTGKTGNSTSISTNGLLTVSGNETAATFTVSATSTADASKSGTATVTIPALTGSVSVTGTAQIGQSALGVNISSLGGSGNIGYQWTSSSKETGTFTNISGATSQTYSLVSADEGKYIKVTVTRSENIGSVTSSNALGPVLLPALTGSVTISGTAQREQTLTANTSSLGGSGGTIGYEWTRADSTNGTYNDISGATAQTYKLVAADVGKFIKVTVTRTGYSGSITSEATTAVQQADEVVVSTIQDSTAFNGLTTPANNYNVVDLPPDNKTNVMKVSPTDKWAVAQYSLSAYKGKEITITLSVNVKRTGKAGTLNWQINNSNYPSVATQSNATVNTWYAMSGTWTGTPSDANPALYLNNDDKTTPGSTYYIDSFSVTIVEVSGGGNSGNFNGVTWTNADLGASTFQKTAKNGPYDVEMWNENRQGTASMTLGVNGAFKCSWDGINNVLFRAGRKYDKTKTHSQIGTFTIEYTATFDPGTVNGSRNSYLSVYGWVTGGSPDALIEYYIIEAKGEFDPGTGTGAVQVGNTNGVSIDGGTYKLYKVPRSNAPSIEGNKDFMQYFSVRTSNRTSGTISVSQHFAAWNSAGLTSINNGKLYEVSLKAESYGGTSGKSKGSAEITKNILKVGGNEIQ